MKVVILSPHPDDAVLSCWGLLGCGAEVTVVTIFAAPPPPGSAVGRWDSLTGARDANSRWRERADEDRRALALAGLTPVTLPFLDGDYRSGDVPVAELTQALANLRPTVIYTPAALLPHPDHVAARDAALGLRQAGVEVRLYADQPHATMFGWPAWVTGHRDERFLRIEEHWDMTLRAAGIDLSGLRPIVRRLDAEWPAKEAAVATYRTQVPALDQLSRRENLRYELEWSWR